MPEVVKKQLYLTEELNRGVKELAEETGKSESQIMREALAQYTSRLRPESDPFDDLIALDSSSNPPSDLSIQHDKYLYHVPGELDG